jgi:hypothetical protein
MQGVVTLKMGKYYPRSRKLTVGGIDLPENHGYGTKVAYRDSNADSGMG